VSEAECGGTATQLSICSKVVRTAKRRVPFLEREAATVRWRPEGHGETARSRVVAGAALLCGNTYLVPPPQPLPRGGGVLTPAVPGRPPRNSSALLAYRALFSYYLVSPVPSQQRHSCAPASRANPFDSSIRYNIVVPAVSRLAMAKEGDDERRLYALLQTHCIYYLLRHASPSGNLLLSAGIWACGIAATTSLSPSDVPTIIYAISCSPARV